ncbi:MAG: 30S ribosomal protein S20 [Myxococcota bacterium]
MANHKSAIKRIRQTERRRKRNQHARSGMRTQIRRLVEAVKSGDEEAARAQFPVTERSVRRAATHGLIPQRRANRKISQMAQSINRLTP